MGTGELTQAFAVTAFEFMNSNECKALDTNPWKKTFETAVN